MCIVNSISNYDDAMCVDDDFIMQDDDDSVYDGDDSVYDELDIFLPEELEEYKAESDIIMHLSQSFRRLERYRGFKYFELWDALFEMFRNNEIHV